MKKFKTFINQAEYPYETRLDEYIESLFYGGWEGDEDLILLERKSTPEEKAANDAAMDAKRRSTASKRVSKMFDVYGDADKERISMSKAKDIVSKRFDELAAMTPTQRKTEIDAAKARRKQTTLPEVLGGNSKTETAAEIPTEHGPKGQIPVSMSFTPDQSRHYKNRECSEFSTHNSCRGSTSSCRPGTGACLAATGNYEFATNKGHRDAYTQGLYHNEAAAKDHATNLWAELEKHTSNAKKQGKNVLVRPGVSDDEASDIHTDAIVKHFGINSERHKAGTHAPALVMRYTKTLTGDNEADKKRGVYNIFSDPGPTWNYKGGKKEKNEENLRRRAQLNRATVEHGLPTYMVFKGKRPGASDEEGGEAYKNQEKILGSVHTVRRYDMHHSEPEAGEARSYHNEKGFGRIEHNGKSYRYQDHPVADSVKTVEGKTILPADHDARNVDTSSRTFYSPSGKKVGHVVPVLSVKSTKNQTLENSGFFHHVDKIENGIYHDSHPKDLEEAGHQSQNLSQAKKQTPKITVGGKEVEKQNA